ncbi:hypothetical protein JW916_03085 [Candidatus Sumerlaeota bacterium]|nr:hypothetical protein [Candidatus Sumerlaeota bacterium]
MDSPAAETSNGDRHSPPDSPGRLHDIVRWASALTAVLLVVLFYYWYEWRTFARFSKIAGEMVPHLAVEEKIQECLATNEPVCAITSLPDEKKGERLVVLLTPEAGDPATVHTKLKESGLPNLWMPALANMTTIDKIPILGSGKVDLKALRAIAEERLGAIMQ